MSNYFTEDNEGREKLVGMLYPSSESVAEIGAGSGGSMLYRRRRFASFVAFCENGFGRWSIGERVEVRK
jgi:hypothetical protein